MREVPKKKWNGGKCGRSYRFGRLSDHKWFWTKTKTLWSSSFFALLCCWEKNYKNELSSLLLWQPQRQYLWAHKCINIWRFLECARCLFQSMAKIHLETKQNSHHFIEIYASLKYPVIHVSVWWICLLPFCCYREDASHWCSFTFQAKLSISISHAEKESDIQMHFKSNTNNRR